MKSAFCISTLVQPCRSSRDGTKRVQAYWKLATAIMPRMPAVNCTQRLRSSGVAGGLALDCGAMSGFMVVGARERGPSWLLLHGRFAQLHGGAAAFAVAVVEAL